MNAEDVLWLAAAIVAGVAAFVAWTAKTIDRTLIAVAIGLIAVGWLVA